MSLTNPPFTDTWLNQASPRATSSMPVARMALNPKRVTSSTAQARRDDDHHGSGR